MYDFKMPTIADFFINTRRNMTLFFLARMIFFQNMPITARNLKETFNRAKGEDVYALPPSEYFADINAIYSELTEKETVRIFNFTPMTYLTLKAKQE